MYVGRAGATRVEPHLFFPRDRDDHFVQRLLHLPFEARLVEMRSPGAPIREALRWFLQPLSALHVSARVILAPRAIRVRGEEVNGHRGIFSHGAPHVHAGLLRGVREFGIQSPDGHDIGFGEVLPEEEN